MNPSVEEKRADSEQVLSKINDGCSAWLTIYQKSDEKSPRIRVVLSKLESATGFRRDYEQHDIESTPVKSQGVATFRRRLATDGKSLESEEIDVESDALKELLAKILDHVPAAQFKAEHVNFHSPFKEFVWQWSKLEKACEPCETDTQQRELARQDLNKILDLIKASDSLGGYFNNLASHTGGDTVAFKHVWTLFEPGTKIYKRAYMEEIQMFEVKSTTMLDRPDKKDFIVFAAAFDWNGTEFKPYVYNFAIPKFDGSQSITNLPCFPVKHYHDMDGSKLEEELLKRGRRFSQLCLLKEVQHEYQGSIMFNDTRPPLFQSPPRMQIPGILSSLSDSRLSIKVAQLNKSKVIIDNYSYMRSRRNPGFGKLALGQYFGQEVVMECPCNACQNNSITKNWPKEILHYKVKEGKRQLEFANLASRLLLCPPKVLGYSLKLGCWCQFSVNNVMSIDLSTAKTSETFEQGLELEEEQKKLLMVRGPLRRLEFARLLIGTY
jgi:hypothetical protein